MIARLLGAQAIWSFTGYLFTFLVGLPLQILIARTVGADGLGTFNLVEAAISVLATLLSFGLASSALKFLPQLGEAGNYTWMRRLVRRDLGLLAAVGGATVVLAVLVYAPAAAWLPPEISFWFFVLAALLVPLSLLLFYMQQILRAFLAVRQIVLGTSVLQLSVKAVVVVFALMFGLGVGGLILAATISCSIALIYLAHAAKAHLLKQGQVPAGDWNELVARHTAFARNQYKGGLLGLLSGNMDRFLLGYHASVSSVGVFGIARMLANLPGVFLQLLVAGSAPMFSRFHAANAHDQALKLYHLSVDWSVRLSFPFFAFIAIYAESLLSYFGAEFAIAGEAALLVLLASATLNSLTGPLGIFMNMWGGETILLRIGVVHEVILVAAYIFLIPRFGLVGAASANLAAMGYSAIAGYLAARKHAGVCWFDRRYLRWPLPMLAFATLCFYFRDARWVVPGIVNLVGIFAGLFVMFHAMFLLYGLHEDDRVLVSAIREKAAAVRGSLAALLYRRP